MEKEERKIIQRLWEDIVWCVCRVGPCLKGFVCIKWASPAQGPGGDLSMQPLPARGWVSATPLLGTAKCTSSPALCARKTPAELRNGKGKQELLCSTGLMPLSRWRCHISVTQHSQAHPTAGHSEEGQLSHHQLWLHSWLKGWCIWTPSLQVFGVNPFTLGSVSAKEGWVHRAVVTLAETLDIWLHSWTDFPLSGVFPCKFYQIYLLRGSDSWSYDQSYERATTGNS